MIEVLTEREVQLALYDYRSNIAAFPVMVPNVYLWNWESDLLYLSRANYVTEYEIKTSRADFKADKRKGRKHFRLSVTLPGPKYFYYVCPADMIYVDEVPEYAGLMYLSTRNRPHCYSGSNYKIQIVDKAPARKVEPLTNKQIWELLSKGTERYWSERRKR